MDKLVSVVIPTFNRQDLTDRAVNSVRTVHPEWVEILVVDDGGSLPYVRSQQFNPAGAPVRVIRTELNQGPGLARRTGVEKASGSVIAFLDSDDIFSSAWIDTLLEQLLRLPEEERERIFIGGCANGGTPFQLFIVRLLARVPAPCRKSAVRVCTIFFNPFYTPATAISKSLCRFSAAQHCEDYFTNAMAIFSAHNVVVLRTVACTIARSPGHLGGLSAARHNMRQGERQVRREMARAKCIPVRYKFLLPLGMIYASLRELIRPALRRTRSL